MYSASHNSVCLEFHILTVLYAGGSSVNLQREIDSVKSGILKAADGTETFYKWPALITAHAIPGTEAEDTPCACPELRFITGKHSCCRLTPSAGGSCESVLSTLPVEC